MDYHLLINIFCVILLPVLLIKLFKDILDVWKYFNRETETPVDDYIYMSDLFDRKTKTTKE